MSDQASVVGVAGWHPTFETVESRATAHLAVQSYKLNRHCRQASSASDCAIASPATLLSCRRIRYFVQIKRGKRAVALHCRRAFTLLEVILALAILVGALAVLGELIRNGLNSATRAREVSRATLLCESKLAEVLAGVEAADTVIESPFEQDPDWLYSIETQSVDGDTGLLSVRVTVSPLKSSLSQPTQCSLVRWMKDPNAVPIEDPAAADSSSSSGNSSSTSASSDAAGGSR